MLFTEDVRKKENILKSNTLSSILPHNFEHKKYRKTKVNVFRILDDCLMHKHVIIVAYILLFKDITRFMDVVNFCNVYDFHMSKVGMFNTDFSNREDVENTALTNKSSYWAPL